MVVVVGFAEGLKEGGAAGVGFGGGGFVAAGVGVFEEVAHVLLVDRWEEGREERKGGERGRWSVDGEGGRGWWIVDMEMRRKCV